MSQARIGRVRMKNGGADVRVLHTPRRADNGENWNGKLVEHAKTLAADPAEIVGYHIVAVYQDGAYNSASRIDPVRCPIPQALWPSYVAEVIRREIIVRNDVRDIVDNEYVRT